MTPQDRGATLSRGSGERLLEQAEGDLAGALAAGERSAFEQVYRRHHQEIYRYCLGITRNRSDAEDALQATMAAALRALPGEQRAIAIRPWLFRVAHNESVSLLRTRHNDLPEVDEMIAAGASTAERAEQRERLEELVADLGRLPERQRGALIMRELSDLSFKEIGAALSCSEPAARQTVFAARGALRDAAEGREMDCEVVQRAISDRDRRKLRGRKLAAHLAVCDSCRRFRDGIEARQGQLQALCPPLAAVAATSILSSIAGGASAGAGAAVGAGGAAGAGGSAGLAGAGTATGGGLAAGAGALGTGAVVKGASIAAATVIAAGAADLSGVAELPGPLDLRDTAPGTTVAPATESDSTSAAGKPGSDRAKEARAKGVAASTAKGANGKSRGRGRNGPKGRGEAAKGRGGGKPSGVGGGKPETTPGGGKPESVGGGKPGATPGSGGSQGGAGGGPAGANPVGGPGAGGGKPGGGPGGSKGPSEQPTPGGGANTPPAKGPGDPGAGAGKPPR